MGAIKLRRRGALAAAAAGLVGVPLLPRAAGAQMQAATEEAIMRATGGRMPQGGRVALRLPPVAENGDAVPLAVQVESPMTAADHAKAVHVFAAENPAPDVATFRFTPAMGRARADTRIRLATTQDVIAVAEMSDGSVWMASAGVKVAVGGGCAAGRGGDGDGRAAAPIGQPRLRLPAQAKAGEIIEIVTSVSHPMAAGLRCDRPGGAGAPDIIKRFVARFDGQEVFAMDLATAISADPYIAFAFKAEKAGAFEFVWANEAGEVRKATAELKVG